MPSTATSAAPEARPTDHIRVTLRARDCNLNGVTPETEETPDD
jgi:hypothetical protein